MSPKLIVLVEDDANLRQSIALILQRAGYCVTATDCANKALSIIQSGGYHLLITDINMPDARKTLIPKVLAMHPSLSIMVLTDQSTSEIEKEYKLLSAHYLIKPIAPERLLDYVETIMGEKGKSNHNHPDSKPINQNLN
jgi:DNA-binding NtrC family response regulator